MDKEEFTEVLKWYAEFKGLDSVWGEIALRTVQDIKSPMPLSVKFAPKERAYQPRPYHYREARTNPRIRIMTVRILPTIQYKKMKQCGHNFKIQRII